MLPADDRAFNRGFDDREGLLRLHLNENPLGHPGGVDEAVARELVRAHRYPDSECRVLTAALARHWDLGPDRILVGNGVDELVLVAALAFVRPGDAVVVAASTFPGYAVATRVAGGTPVAVELVDRRVPVAAMAAQMDGCSASFICNPHNPTGHLLSRAELAELVDATEHSGSALVVDEAYAEFAAEDGIGRDVLVRSGARSVVLRTFSKAYGLAGFRVGYAVGAAELIAAMRHVSDSLPFSVNRFAQATAVACLDDRSFLDAVRTSVGVCRDALYGLLDAIPGVGYQRSHANFVLLWTEHDSGDVARRLLDRHRILVRDASPFGLPRCLRVTVAAEADMRRFADALASVVSELDRAPATVGVAGAGAGRRGVA